MMRHCSYFGNPWIGMFIATNGELALLPLDAPENLEAKAAEALGARVLRVSIADSNLLGLYVAMNSNGTVLPNVALDSEVEKLRGAGLNVYRSEERNNANGNNIALNDKGGVVNPNVSEHERRKMENVLGVELVPMRVAQYSTVGSCVLAGNGGFLAHYAAKPEEMAALESALKVKGGRGTVNTGAGFVGCGVVATSKGYLAGEATTAFELGRVEEALGFIK